MTHAPTRRPQPRGAVVATLVAAVALALAGCGDDGGDEATAAGSSTTTEATTTTTAPSTSTAPTSTEDGPDETATTEGPDAPSTTGGAGALAPGDPCSLEEGIPDCIDPDGDGEGVYLIGGAACMATAPDPVACEDTDGDGVAGTTDEFADLPTCGDDVPPPCNNPPGSSEESRRDPGDSTTTGPEDG